MFGHDVPGHGDGYGVSTADECHDSCVADPNCHYWTWTHPDAKVIRKAHRSRCFLKTEYAVSGFSSVQGVVGLNYVMTFSF